MAKKNIEFIDAGTEVVPGMRLRCLCLGHTRHISDIKWSPCGRFIASTSVEGTIRIWDAADGKCIETYHMHDSKPQCVTWSPDSKNIAWGDRGGRILIYKVLSGDTTFRALSNSPDIQNIEWAPNGRIIAISNRKGFELFDVSSRTWISKFSEYHPTTGMKWSKDSLYITYSTPSYISSFGIDKQNPDRNSNKYVKDGLFNLTATSDEELIVVPCLSEVHLLERTSMRLVHSIEGHTDIVTGVSLDYAGRVLATKSMDNSVRLWDLEHKSEILKIYESCDRIGNFRNSTQFHPSDPCLATLGGSEFGAHSIIRIWDINFSKLSKLIPKPTVIYSSAKIVLVGDSNVGKSCLAMMLAENRYPEDYEQGTTHGMRFWHIGEEQLQKTAKSSNGHRREIVLWDFGGQDEYQLVHQMFLHDTTMALILIDPTRGRSALDEARDWYMKLEKHLGKTKAIKFLIGTKVDRKSDLIDLNSINNLCEEYGYGSFFDLSAKTGRNINKLRNSIIKVLDWDKIGKASRPELFQLIRDDIESRRKKNQILLSLKSFKRSIKKSAGKLFEEEAVDAVSDQLAKQGIIVRAKLSSGDDVIVLQLPIIERYAGSLIIAARNNPRGVPVLEERLLGSTKKIPLPGMKKKERISPAKERMVLECIVELMIQHGICFRHGGLLVFPTLFPAGSKDEVQLSHSVSLYYDFTGAIDNIYASLVSKLMVSEEFGEGRLRAGSVEFERPGEGICGFIQSKFKGGCAHLDLFFSNETSAYRRDLFTRFVEEHLRRQGVEIREHQAIKCRCGEEISVHIIEENIIRGHKDVICPFCREVTLISEGVDRIRDRNPNTVARMVALRKMIDNNLNKDVAIAKKVVAGEFHVSEKDEPIRILHLSDLHFTKETNPDTKLQLLLQDLRREDEEYLAIETVEYLVISGDLTNKGNDVGFEKARQFIESLVEELGLSTHRCILVPGNHDVQDRDDAYEERETEAGEIIKVRNPDNFPKRFKPFSNMLFHPLLQKNYPLKYEEQGIPYLFPETAIQFLTLNSAWQIDKYGRKKAGIHFDAITGVLSRAEDERKKAIERNELKQGQDILRIGVWHHAVAGPELMKDLGFLSQLQVANMRICLHGDVHETRTELFGYRQPGINIEILGAGSFGSAAEERPESTPKLYNLLEVYVNSTTGKHEKIRVHSRQQKKDSEAWQGYYEWTKKDSTGRFSYFDIDLEGK